MNKRQRRPLTGRYFVCLLYPDDDLFEYRLKQLDDHYEYVGIKHDKDTWDFPDTDHEVGDLKKPHYHFVFRIPSKNPTSLISVFNRLTLPYHPVYDEIGDGKVLKCLDGAAAVCLNRRASFRYLVHADDLNKAQYCEDDIISNSSDMLHDCLNAIMNSSIDYKVLEMIELLDNIDYVIDAKEFAILCAQAGLWSAVRGTPQWMLQNILESHNNYYSYDQS